MNVTKRIRTTAIAGLVAIAALLGGTAAVVADPVPHVEGGASVAIVPAPQFEGAQPTTEFLDAQLTNVFHGAAPGPVYNGIQLTTMFQGAAPGPAFED